MFHDVFGHVPLLTNNHFCEYLKGLSKIALKYIDNEYAIELISRVYWYTVEFGLIEDTNGLRIYGAGILSSSGESIYCLGNKPKRIPYNVKEIMETPYIKDKFQEKYWVINSYQQLFESIIEIENTLKELLLINH
jgi:phenylalanine-4-hydroxylase